MDWRALDIRDGVVRMREGYAWLKRRGRGDDGEHGSEEGEVRGVVEGSV